jgi:DNA-binding response OmpR family regulator
MASLMIEPDKTNGRCSTILVVDDENTVHAMVKHALSRAFPDGRYSVISALNGTEAVRMIATDSPDIVITDAMMPGLSGFDLIREIKSRAETSDIPIILVTSLESENGAVMDASGKADFCIGKPFDLDEVVECVERAERLIQHRHTVSRIAARPYSHRVLNVA